MSEVALRVRDIGKTYRIYSHPVQRLIELLTRRQRHQEFTALRNVSFDVPRGEGVGIVGENGAGKSTLLKILAGIAAPSAGSYEVDGKVAAILELGSGFHPEFTGRQNIVLNAAMLGLSEAEVDEKLPSIIEFSELGGFIDQPVKSYSTGMAMRLAFAIATQIDPEVLIIDEALSVGDGYFQKKCFDRLEEFIGGGGTLLFCSHAMYYVSNLCQHVIWLRDGRIEAMGSAVEVVRAYEDYLLSKARPTAESGDEGRLSPRHDVGGSPARLTSVESRSLADGGGGATATVAHGDGWELRVRWKSADPACAFQLGVGIDRSDGVQVASFSTHRDGFAARTGGREYEVRLVVPSVPMLSGSYDVAVFLMDENALHVYDRRRLNGSIEVGSEAYQPGLIDIPHRWDVDERAATIDTMAAAQSR